MRLAGDPPARVAIDGDFLGRGSWADLLADKSWDQVPTELRDQHAQTRLPDQRNARPGRVRQRDLAAGRTARDIDGIRRPELGRHRDREPHGGLRPGDGREAAEVQRRRRRERRRRRWYPVDDHPLDVEEMRERY